MKQYKKLTVALCLIWAASVLYGEMFAFWVPSLWSCSWPHHHLLKKDGVEDHRNFTKVAVIADPQLMDKTSHHLPRFALEAAQFYTDLNMRRSFFQSIMPFKPDAIIFLGDYFDGGPFLSNEEWQGSLSRFKHVFGLTARDRVGDIPVYYIPGNHDIGYSRILSLKPQVIDRYEKEFGTRNYRLNIGSVEFIAIDAQTLDGKGNSTTATWNFVKNATSDAQSHPRVLLTHIPLYRPDRTYCSPYRGSSIINQRIWRAPQDQEVTYQNYITEESSRKLLEMVKPEFILSGHDHDQCTVTHESKFGQVTEQTLGTISWQQGNLYPSFMLLSVRNSLPPNTSGDDKAVLTQLCFLPMQTHVYLWYLSLFVLTLLALLLWPNHGITFLNQFSDFLVSTGNLIISSLSSGTKEKDEDENCEYEMVWDAEGSMHLVKKVVNTPFKRPSDKGVVERGNAVMRAAARKNTSEEIEILTDVNTNPGSDPLVRSASKTDKSRTKLIIQRLIRTIKMVIVIAALNVPIYMMLLFKDWIDQWHLHQTSRFS